MTLAHQRRRRRAQEARGRTPLFVEAPQSLASTHSRGHLGLSRFVVPRGKMKIEALLTYPIKGLRAHSLDSAELTKHGFTYDRRFMLLEVKKGEDGSTTLRNMAIAHDPRGSRFFPTLHQPSDYNAKDGKITVTFKPPPGEGVEKTLEIPLEPSTEGLEVNEVTMHKSPTKAYQMSAEYCRWFSDCFGYEVILVYLGEHLRPVLMSSTHADATTQQPASGGSAG
ncbi:hypothetical protein LTR95_018349 [Oleoguttula sp. CCFEE 5521]